MRARSLLHLVLGTAIALTLSTAATAGTSVPASRSGRHQAGIEANGLKPSQCAALSLTAIVAGQGAVIGGASNELLLGGIGVDSVDGRGGDDCILGGAGSDILDGGTGNDVCIGGPGIDTFTSCETEIQ